MQSLKRLARELLTCDKPCDFSLKKPCDFHVQDQQHSILKIEK